jgi:hypothetical protein
VGRLSEQGAERKLIAHSAGKNEQGGLMAGQISNVGFEVIGRWVLMEDIVEEGAILNGGEHGGSGRGDDIA